MTTYRLTFGQQWAREPHPRADLVALMGRIHPDGWWEIDAVNAEDARALVVELLGVDWSVLYNPDEWRPDQFPLGCLARVETDRFKLVSRE